jgi:CheY-like chemotaxis protein
MEGQPGQRRVLVVEDELMIRMLLEDMLGDLGYAVAAAVGRVAEAVPLAREAQFDLAILDVSLNGEPVYPVADILRERGLPFVFSTGHGSGALVDDYRRHPVLQKPYELERLDKALAGLLASPR